MLAGEGEGELRKCRNSACKAAGGCTAATSFGLDVSERLKLPH